jgi:hypothetical protein
MAIKNGRRQQALGYGHSLFVETVFDEGKAQKSNQAITGAKDCTYKLIVPIDLAAMGAGMHWESFKGCLKMGALYFMSYTKLVGVFMHGNTNQDGG